MLNFKNFKNEMLECINSNATINKKQELINKAVQLINPKIRCYYNFSISDFIELLKGSEIYEDYNKAISTLNSSRQYMIYTKEEYEDFKEFLNSDMADDGESTIKRMESSKLIINENLYIFDTNELNPIHQI